MRPAWILALWVGAVAGAGCKETPYAHLPGPAPRPARPAFQVPPGLTRLRLGLVPYVSEETLRRTHGKLARYLGQELGVEIEVVVGKSYDDVGGMLERSELDFAELSPFVYVRTRQKVALRPLAMAIADGSDTAASYLVVRQDSPMKKLDDLKGHSFGFVDPASTTGYLFPRNLLRSRGFDLEKDLPGSQFLGNHEAVLLAVLDGGVAAGGIYQGALAALKRSSGVDPLSFRVLAKTPRSPRDLYVARADLSPAVGDALTRLLLDIDTRTPQGRELLGPMDINGYVPADVHAYDDVEKAQLADH